MEIKLKENIVFISYDDQNLLKERILDFIANSKTNKIIYKGDPMEINHKLLKKILPLSQEMPIDENNINRYVDVNPTKNVKDVYLEFLSKINCEFCLIHKI